MQEAINRVNEWINNNNPDEFLMLNSLGLEELPDIPESCKYLNCSSNELTKLPKLPNCEELICRLNELESLPDLPLCRYLNCEHNNLKYLPELPNCESLDCDSNKLLELPQLPKCKELYCSHNYLFLLPYNLSKCTRLWCFGNHLLYLPLLAKNKDSILFDIKTCNVYLHINKQQAQKYDIPQTPNYNRAATTIQKAYKKYTRTKYNKLLIQHLLRDPIKVISLYII